MNDVHINPIVKRLYSVFVTQLELCLATAKHNSKRVKINLNVKSHPTTRDNHPFVEIRDNWPAWQAGTVWATLCTLSDYCIELSKYNCAI